MSKSVQYSITCWLLFLLLLLLLIFDWNHGNNFSRHARRFLLTGVGSAWFRCVHTAVFFLSQQTFLCCDCGYKVYQRNSETAMSPLFRIISVSERDESSGREESITGRQVKVNFGELFKKIFNEFGHIMERTGMRNEEWGWLQCIMRFWCGNEICYLQRDLQWFLITSPLKITIVPPTYGP